MLGSARWEAKPLDAAVKRAAIVVDAVSWARDLVNTPAGDMPPAEIAREAQAMARAGGPHLQGLERDASSPTAASTASSAWAREA